MDGYITIGTELDTDKFDRQITDLEKKMKHEENNKISIETKLSGQEKQLDEERKKVDDLSDAYWRMKEAQDAIESGIATPSQLTSFFEMKDNFGSLEQLESTFNKALDKQDKIQQKVDETKRKYEEVIGKVDEYKVKIESVNLKRQQYEIEQTRAKMSGLSNSVQGIVHKVGKWALALFSVRSVYNIIRQSVSTLTQQNQELSDQITAIKTSLANALEPIIQFVVDVATKVVAVIGYILKLLFGIDIFAKKATNNVKKTTKAVKGLGGVSSDLKKQLAGFDEINMLNKDGSTGGLGGLGDDIDGVVDKMKDMSKMGEGLFKDLINWLNPFTKEAQEAIKGTILGIKVGLAPLANWINNNVWQPIKLSFSVLIEKLKPILDPLKKAFAEVVEYVKPIWEQLKTFFKVNIIDPIIEFWKPIGQKLYEFFAPGINNIIDIINSVFGIFGIHLDHLETNTEKKLDNIEKDTNQKGKEIEQDLTKPMDNAGQKVDDLSKKTIDIKSDTTNIENVDDGLHGILQNLWQMIGGNWNVTTTFDAKLTQGYINAISSFSNLITSGASSIFKLPFMATGGIVNMPNKGTLVGGAMAGESGKEGVVPLTDQQAMAELGREIGKNVLVNLTNIMQMNGRVISREMKQVTNTRDFAYNT